MQAGEPAEAFTMIQQILEGSSPDLKDSQTLYAVLVTAGLAGLASEDLNAAERSFRRATELSPDAPQVQTAHSFSRRCTAVAGTAFADGRVKLGTKSG